MKHRLTWLPHRHRVSIINIAEVRLDGQGETDDVELCRCTAWRVVGHRAWHGSMFRTTRGENR